jgi:hypothetical protein
VNIFLSGVPYHDWEPKEGKKEREGKKRKKKNNSQCEYFFFILPTLNSDYTAPSSKQYLLQSG